MDQFVFIITSRSAARKKNKPCSKSKFLQNEKQIKKKKNKGRNWRKRDGSDTKRVWNKYKEKTLICIVLRYDPSLRKKSCGLFAVL